MKESIQSIKEKLTPIFKNHGVRKAILFGSYAKGEERENSDIDILVDSGLIGLDFFGLLEDVCVNLTKQVDLIDTQDVIKGGKVDLEITKTGVIIYEQ
jgi:hypothetical protein